MAFSNQPWPDHRLTDLLKITHPLILAPMAGIGTVELAAAVCAAGGLGSLGCAAMSPDAMLLAVEQLRALATSPINVNFFCHAPAVANTAGDRNWAARLTSYRSELGLDSSAALQTRDLPPFGEAMCDAVEQAAPEVVSFHFGLPEPRFVARIKSAGSTVISTATTVSEALWLEAHGVDIIIAQGAEAGGHRGMFLPESLNADITTHLGTFALVPQVADAVSVPVVAAGGVGDARGITAAFALGAAGAQIGTAYLRCPEAGTPPLHREALRRSHSDETVAANVFTGRQARALANRFTREVGPLSSQVPAFPIAIGALAPIRSEAERQGSTDFSAVWAGQAAGLGTNLPAETLTRMLASSALARLRRIGRCL